jgi:spore coat protein A, manganese oxidase
MLTRRQFLKLSAGAGAGLLLPIRWRGGARQSRMVRAEALADFLLDPALQPKFVHAVPNALAPSFIYTPRDMGGFDRYDVGMYPIQQQLGLVNPETLAPLTTPLWGYGTNRGTATFPGRTFIAWEDRAVEVQWTNNLVHENGEPVDHLLPVDTSLHWAYSLHGYTGYTIESQGVPVVPHLHGGHTESDSDGLPEYFWSPGETVVGPRFVKSLYHYDNDQEPGTLWYHDHVLGITRLNVYAGLAGFYILRNKFDSGASNNALSLPAYPYEAALAIQDRMFERDGALFYPAFPGDPAWDDFITGEGLEDDEVPQPSVLAEFFGDHILVNGVIWPKMDVEPRHYRLRLLNGSDSRFYVLQLKLAAPDGETPIGAPRTFYQVGTDVGLLEKAVPLTHLILGPGERADLVVDFSTVPQGTRIILENIAPDAPFGGAFGDAADPEDFFPDREHSTLLIMAFDVSLPKDKKVPDRFNPNRRLRLGGSDFRIADPPARVRKLALFEGLDEYGRLQPLLGVAEPTEDAEGNIVDRSLGWFEPITEDPRLDDVEIWEVFNTTPDAHPIHVHLVAFEILSRQGFTGTVEEVPQPQHDGSFGVGGRLTNITLTGQPVPPMPNERGPKDTALMLPEQVTRIKMRFDRPGRYVWHCHILSHEDHEMMRPYHVG